MSVDFNKIKALREEIRKLLEEKPELQELQDEIDRELAKCGNNTQRRNAVIQQIMLNTWYQIVPACKDLKNAQKVEETSTKLRIITNKED